MANPSHNERLDELLSTGESNVDQAESQPDLLKQIQRFAEFDGPLEFDFTVAWWFFGIGALLIACGGALYWLGSIALLDALSYRLQIAPLWITLGIALIGLALAGGSLIWINSTSDRLPTLSRNIARLSSFYHNGLKYVDETPGQTLNRLNTQFGDYKRGNYSRELHESIQGTFLGSLRAIPYEYHHLHYVEQRTVVTVVSDGKGGTKTVTQIVYDHYDRYSLVLDFPWVTGISVRSDGHSHNDFAYGMDTASPDFNRAFSLTGLSEMACAKFIRPSTVLHLLGLFKLLNSFNLEFAETGKLCISFSNDDLLSFGTQYSLLAPQQFYTEISKGVELPRLMSVLRWGHALTELHDDNFSTSTPPINQEN